MDLSIGVTTLNNIEEHIGIENFKKIYRDAGSEVKILVTQGNNRNNFNPILKEAKEGPFKGKRIIDHVDGIDLTPELL